MSVQRTPVAKRLPDFPWDSLAGAKKKAGAHPKGLVDLSVGSPVDPVAPSIQLALAEGAAAPGYPQTKGTPELRKAIVGAMRRRFGVERLEADTQVLPVVGTKEAIAWLPTLLGLGAEHTVVIPELAYPTYEVGAKLVGAKVLRSDSLLKFGPEKPALIFLNSPANPHGQVLGVEHLRKFVEFARTRGAIVVSDECYLGLGWEGQRPVSILDPEVCGGDFTNLIAVHSLSKTSNMASYRAGWLAGDPGLIGELLEVRRHAGLMVPGPVQSAMVAALEEDGHEILQKEEYRKRREVLKKALESAGFSIEHSTAGLYLWATRGEDGRATIDFLAELGILAAPGDFYGPKGKKFVRLGLTASNEKIAEAAARLSAATKPAAGKATAAKNTAADAKATEAKAEAKAEETGKEQPQAGAKATPAKVVDKGQVNKPSEKNEAQPGAQATQSQSHTPQPETQQAKTPPRQPRPKAQPQRIESKAQQGKSSGGKSGSKATPKPGGKKR